MSSAIAIDPQVNQSIKVMVRYYSLVSTLKTIAEMHNTYDNFMAGVLRNDSHD